jgi:L-alanine-DL-glutamate epimerase-like enolase superfamily enzyme
MKIVAVDDIQVSGGWETWSFLKLTTDAGLVGWAEFNAARGRRGLVAVVRDMAELVIGEDPRQVGRLAARLRALTQSSGGGLQALAIGAYENACLDIAAKDLGVPVFALFGGALRAELPVYWSHCGMYRSRHPDLFETVIGVPGCRGLDDIRSLGVEVAAQGFKALKTNLLVFRDGAPAVVGRGSGAFETNIERDIVRRVVDQLQAFRDGAGPDVRLMMDLNFNYKPEGFRQIARAVEPFDMMWLEMDSFEPRALQAIRQAVATPIASLEMVLGRRALRPFLDAGAVDVAIIDVVFNGLLESLKMAALADAHDVNVAVHNSHGPLGSLISAHFATLIPNLRILEYDADEMPWRRELLTQPWVVTEGLFRLPQGPGWGADIDEAVARRHPPDAQPVAPAGAR